MINKTFRKNKKFKAVIALTLISSILTACGSKTTTAEITSSEAFETETATTTADIPNLEAGDKSLADLFLNHSSEDDDADDEQDDNYEDDDFMDNEEEFDSDLANDNIDNDEDIIE